MGRVQPDVHFAVSLRFLGIRAVVHNSKVLGEPPGLSEVHLIMVQIFPVADSRLRSFEDADIAAFLAKERTEPRLEFESSKPPVKTVIAVSGACIHIHTSTKLQDR